ncbi:MAG: hypothetical protein HY866_12465 [Chloroflexi bacterium]|nr:hypothetical protein [Chloroflexota bacterium]
MNDSGQESKPPEIEFVGAPTQFADAQEVPEWVANIAKLIIFLPAAWVTATTIPIIVFSILGVCLLFSCLLLSLVF